MTVWIDLNERQRNYFSSMSVKLGYSTEILLWAWDHISDWLDDIDGLDSNIYACDLSNEITLNANVNGFVDSPCACDAKEFIKDHFDDCGTCFENQKLNGDIDNVPNPFDDPVRFVVIVYIDVVDNIISNLDFIKKHWDEDLMTFDKKAIDHLRYEMCMIDEDTYDNEEDEDEEV